MCLSACAKKEELVIPPEDLIDMTSYQQEDLYQAIRDNDLSRFKTILSYGIDPNYYFAEETWDKRPGVMELAVLHRHDDFLELALSHRGNPNAITENGVETLAFVAVVDNDIDKLKLLIKHGADIGLKGENDYTLFHKAILIRRFEIASFLYDQGADTTSADQWGYSPLDTLRKHEARQLLDDSDPLYISLKHKLIRDASLGAN